MMLTRPQAHELGLFLLSQDVNTATIVQPGGPYTLVEARIWGSDGKGSLEIKSGQSIEMGGKTSGLCT